MYRASEYLDVSDVQKVLTTSQKNNNFYELTGCLLYSGRHFAQVLEGPLVDVIDLLQIISSDSRQTQMRVLSNHYTSIRSYSKSPMAGLYNPGVDIQIKNMLIPDSKLPPITQLSTSR